MAIILLFTPLEIRRCQGYGNHGHQSQMRSRNFLKTVKTLQILRKANQYCQGSCGSLPFLESPDPQSYGICLIRLFHRVAVMSLGRLSQPGLLDEGGGSQAKAYNLDRRFLYANQTHRLISCGWIAYIYAYNHADYRLNYIPRDARAGKKARTYSCLGDDSICIS